MSINLALYRPGTSAVTHFLLDAVSEQASTGAGRNYIGTGLRLMSVQEGFFSEKWTTSITVASSGGYDKLVSQLSASTGMVKVMPVSQESLSEAYRIRELITGLSYAQLDSYIDTNVTDLASAKVYLKRLSKVVLALSKIVDRRMG